MNRFKVGLVVGKFAPLHKGHELLIRTAIGRCERVVVLSYTRPEFRGCSPYKRRQWLQLLFPGITAIVLGDDAAPMPHNNDSPEVHRHFVADVLEQHGVVVDAVFTSESYGDPLATVLDERQRLRGSSGDSVVHVCVDPERKRVPVSATQLRASRPLRDRFLDSRVKESMLGRICILGGEATGKTTLARALADRLDEPWVGEYGRELWEARGGKLNLEDLVHIAEEQVRREAAALHAARHWLVCDTSPLTTLFYTVEMFAAAAPSLERMAMRGYDVYVLCADDFDFIQDGTRRDEAFRRKGQEWYRAKLLEQGVEWHEARGSVDDRVDAVARLLVAEPALVTPASPVP